MDENQDTTTPSEEQAIAEALAGYQGKARAQAPAAEEKPVESPALPDQPQASASEEDPEAGTEPEAQPEEKPDPTAQVAQQLDDLKAQVRELKASGADAETVRKMHGDIGEINRTLKSLKALEKTDAPAEDELAAALRDAEATASEYPELAGPLVKAIKVLQSRLVTPAPETPPAPETKLELTPAPDAQALREQAKREAAIAALDEVHPDRHELRKDAEFQAWFKAKPPEYQKKATTSWNPAVVAQPFTDFKAWRIAQKRKQERLESAAVPQGALAHSQPTAISDEEAARIGYERARGKRL